MRIIKEILKKNPLGVMRKLIANFEFALNLNFETISVKMSREFFCDFCDNSSMNYRTISAEIIRELQKECL